jgi:hypothetical protein
MLDTLLHRVSQGELTNERDILLAAAEKSHRRQAEKTCPDRLKNSADIDDL